MGGGKGGGGCSNVGYGYSLTFGYAFCDKLDELLGFYMNGKKKWSGSITTNSSFTAWTGNLGTTYSSSYKQAKIQVMLGTQTSAPVGLTGLFPENLSYKNICWLFFNNAFIGDNVMSVPKYRIKGRRTDIYKTTTYSNIDGSANPAYVIYYILSNLLNISDSHINLTSIDYAAKMLYNEGLGVSFFLSRSNKATKWIKEVLRHINGVLYFDIFSSKYTLKLLRADYSTSDIAAFDENNTSSIKLTKGTWKNVITTFIFDYTNIEAGKSASITVDNTASKEILGYDRPKKYSFPMITTSKALHNVINMVVRKNGFPLSSIKLKVSLMDFPNIYPGDVFSFEYIEKNIPKTVYRVIKVSGDSSDTAYLEIEALEDIFATTLNLNTTISKPINNLLNYDIISIPSTYTLYEIDNEFSTYKLLVPVVGRPNTSETITQTVLTNTDTNIITNTPVVNSFILNTDIPQNYTYEPNSIFNINNTGNNIHTITYSDVEFQQHKGLIFINHKVFTYKKIEQNTDGTYSITGLLALSKNIPLIPKTTTTGFITTKDILLTSYLTSFNTPSYNYSLAFRNIFTKGNAVTGIKSRKNYADYPLPCSNLKYYNNGKSNVLVFSPSVRTKGASYISCDNIVAGNDENTFEGVFIVKYNGSQIDVISSPNFVNGYIEYDTTNYNTGTWEIIPSINNFTAIPTTITI